MMNELPKLEKCIRCGGNAEYCLATLSEKYKTNIVYIQCNSCGLRTQGEIYSYADNGKSIKKIYKEIDRLKKKTAIDWNSKYNNGNPKHFFGKIYLRNLLINAHKERNNWSVAELYRILGYIETTLIIMGIVKPGQPIPRKTIKSKILWFKWERKEHYIDAIIRIAEETLKKL